MQHKYPAIRFPYGLSNWKQIATGNYAFVDKTSYIEKLEYTREFVCFLRPRRMGKSLMVSMLEYYYDQEYRGEFDELFGNTYIGKHKTASANSFNVLRMNFSGIDTTTKENSYSGFLFSVVMSLVAFCEGVRLLTPDEVKTLQNQSSPGKALNYVLKLYHKRLDIPIFLIIDEHDHFTNEILIRDMKEFRESVSSNGYVRKFYEVIKDATENNIIGRFFITGVSPLTLDSLTSGFNIISDLTHEESFHEMMGFTEDETAGLLNLVLKEGHKASDIMDEMRMYYNGYKFHVNAERKLYNSNMVLYYIRHYSEYGKAPTPILDVNIMPDYSKLKQMFAVANAEANLEVLETVLREGEVEAKQVYQYNFSEPFGHDDFVNFLYYLGNLTIKESHLVDWVLFKIPNKVIEELYWKFYATVWQDRAELRPQEDKIMRSVLSLAHGDYRPFMGHVEDTLKALSNRDYQRFDEKYIKLLIVAYGMMGGIFDIRSERETPSGGYVDVELLKRHSTKTPHSEYVLEIKYLKKEQAHLLEKTQAEAKAQLQHYLQHDESLHGKAELRALAMVIVKDEVFLEEIPVK